LTPFSVRIDKEEKTCKFLSANALLGCNNIEGLMKKHPVDAMVRRYDEAQQIGRRLKRLRESQALSLQELAPRVGLTHQHLSKIERGIVNTPIETISRVAKALGSSLLKLLQEDDKEGGSGGEAFLRELQHAYVALKHDQEYIGRKIQDFGVLLKEKTSSSSLVHSLLSYTFPPLAAALCAFAMALPLT
jgi:transcriptional regulator with XRE-family HTH domain